MWPSTHVLDTNLASLIAEIRHALGDLAEKPRYVRTVHRFGYWFIGPVQDNVQPPVAGGGERSVRYWLMFDGRQTALTEGENILGRAPEAEIRIDVGGVSRRHARICIDGHQATVEDSEARTARSSTVTPCWSRLPSPMATRFGSAPSSSRSESRLRPSRPILFTQAVVGPPLATDDRSVRPFRRTVSFRRTSLRSG